jgi:hypothetical protein
MLTTIALSPRTETPDKCGARASNVRVYTGHQHSTSGWASSERVRSSLWKLKVEMSCISGAYKHDGPGGDFRKEL